MGVDWGGKIYGGERSEEAKNYLKPYHCLRVQKTMERHLRNPARYSSAPPSRSSQPKSFQKIVSYNSSIISQPSCPRPIMEKKHPAIHFPSPAFLFQNGINNISFPPHNHHQPLMPITRRNTICTYIISQYPCHPAILFSRSFPFQALMSGFRIRGVFGMEYPRLLGQAVNTDS